MEGAGSSACHIYTSLGQHLSYQWDTIVLGRLGHLQTVLALDKDNLFSSGLCLWLWTSQSLLHWIPRLFYNKTIFTESPYSIGLGIRDCTEVAQAECTVAVTYEMLNKHSCFESILMSFLESKFGKTSV